MALVGVVCVRHRARTGVALGLPLIGTGGALREFPLVVEEVFEVVITPAGGRGRPRAFETARDGVLAMAGAVGVVPAEALRLDRRTGGFGADVFARIGRSVDLTEGVAAPR